MSPADPEDLKSRLEDIDPIIPVDDEKADIENMIDDGDLDGAEQKIQEFEDEWG